MNRTRLIPLALLIVATPIAAAPRDPFAGRVAGPPQRCITMSPNMGGTVIDRDTIIYQGTGGRIWRTGPTGTCPSLRPMTTLIVQVYGGQLCQNDRFSTIEPGMSIPSIQCRFRAFVPYSKPKTGK